MRKTLVFTAISPLLYNILHKDVEQEDLSQASMPFVTVPKTLEVTAFYAQNTGIYSVFASLHNILHKDVEQEDRSEQSMPFATVPKALVFIAIYRKRHLLFVYRLRVFRVRSV